MAQDSRTVVGNISVSLDGRINGPGGENDMGWVAPHAVSEAAFGLLLDLMLVRQLVAAGQLDRLRLLLCPEISGGGARLFDDGLPSSSWAPTDSTPTETGALRLTYDARR